MKLYTYSYYKGKSRARTLGRILIIVLLVTAVLASLLILGNLLENRLREAEPLYKLTAAVYGTEPMAETEAKPVIHRTPGAETVRYTALDPAAYGTGGQNITEACAVASQIYDGIAVTVATPSQIFCRLESYGDAASAAAVTADTLRAVTAAADAAGLLSAAVLPYRGDETDASAAAELAALGFREILFTEALTDSLREAKATSLLMTADAVRAEYKNARIGFTLTPAVLRDGMSAMYLDMLADGADFLVLDTSETSGEADALSALLDTLSGSIAYYPLRVLLTGDDVSLAAQGEVAREVGVTAVMVRRNG